MPALMTLHLHCWFEGKSRTNHLLWASAVHQDDVHNSITLPITRLCGQGKSTVSSGSTLRILTSMEPAYPAGGAEPGPASLLMAANCLLQQLGRQMDAVPGIRQQVDSELQQKQEQLLTAKNHLEVRSLSVQIHHCRKQTV